MSGENNPEFSDACGDASIPVDFETQARLEALLEAAGIGKLSTSDGKAFADPDVLHRLTSTVSYALDEAAAALSRLRAEAAGHHTNRSLPEACSDGDVATVRRLLDEGQSVHETTEDGESLLSLACSAGYLELTEVLLSMQASVEERGPKGGCTPLMEASSGGHKDVVSLLLDHGAKVNAVSNTGNTALTFACCGGYVDIVKTLIAAGADLEIQNENGHTPLMEAASGGHVEVAAVLLESGAGINTHSKEFKESALTLACYKGHLEMVQFLLKAGADQEHKTDEMHTALMEASMDGHVDVAKLLLDSGAQVNMPADSFESPLTLAACGGHVSLASLLLSRGANLEEVNDEGYTPLMEACREGHEEMVALLLSHGASVNALTEETRETALTLSACGGFLECSKLLLQAGAKLEAGCSTALMEAAQEGHLDLVKYLLEQGAVVDTQTSSGNTALSFACEHGRTDVADVLLHTGACLEHESEGGRTPLMKAARAGHSCTVQYLISQGANVNKFTRNKEHTALSLACLYGHVSVVELLLLHDADSSVVLKDGSTTLLEAAKGGHTNIVQILLDLPQWFSQSSLRSQCNFEGASPLAIEKPVSRVPTQTLPVVVPPQEPDAAYQDDAEYSPSPDSGNPHIVADRSQPYVNADEDSDTSTTDAAIARNLAEHHATEAVFRNAGEMELTELEQRIKKVIETNAKLKSHEDMNLSFGHNLRQNEDSRILKKQRILEELQKVEYNLQAKAAQQLKNCLDVKIRASIGRSLCRDFPDGEEDNMELLDCEDLSSTSDSDSVEHTMPDAFSVKESANQESLMTKMGSMVDEQLPPTPDISNKVETNINCCTETNNDTPLTLACAGGHTELVKLLIHRGANLEHRDKKGFTPLILAATAGHVGAVTSLLDSGVDIESQSERTKDTALSLACSGGRLEVVEVLLGKGANIEHRNVSDYTPLSLAASGGYVKIIEVLLNAGAEINSRTGSKLGISPLMLAAMNGHKEAVLLLLDMGADINAQIETNRNTALTLACFQGRHEVVSLLVDRRANVEHRAKTGLTPLMEAASGGYAEVGRVLLEKGADPNAAPVPSSRDTALTIAADKGHLLFCELVLSRCAMVDIRNKKGCTPFWLACNGGYLDVAKLLARHEASLDAGDNRNTTPLVAAFRKGHVKVVRWLSKVVSHFPSDSECMRFISGITDRDLLKRCHMCMECITAAKERQAQEANKYASELLEEIDMEKTREENRKERAARKREKRRKKRQEKQQQMKQVEPTECSPERDVVTPTEFKEVNNIEKSVPVPEKMLPRPVVKDIEKPEERLKPQPPSSVPSTKSNTAVPQTPSKKSHKKDEEWKEVVRKSKKIVVPSNLVARIIGRGGCNINAIREETGAHIDINNKHRKGPERTITIRGPTEAIRHAHGLISELMKDNNADVEIQTIIKAFKPTITTSVKRTTRDDPVTKEPSSSIQQSAARVIETAPTPVSSSASPSPSQQPATTNSPVTEPTVVSSATSYVQCKPVQSQNTFVHTTSSSNSPRTMTNGTKDAPISFMPKNNNGKPVNRPVQPVAPMISKLPASTSSNFFPPGAQPSYRNIQSVTSTPPRFGEYMQQTMDQQNLLPRMGNLTISDHIYSQQNSFVPKDNVSSIPLSESRRDMPTPDRTSHMVAPENPIQPPNNNRSSDLMDGRKIWPIGTERAIGQRRVNPMLADSHFVRPSYDQDNPIHWMNPSLSIWGQNQLRNRDMDGMLPSVPTYSDNYTQDMIRNHGFHPTSQIGHGLGDRDVIPNPHINTQSSACIQQPIGSHLTNSVTSVGRDFTGNRVVGACSPYGISKDLGPIGNDKKHQSTSWLLRQGNTEVPIPDVVSVSPFSTRTNYHIMPGISLNKPPYTAPNERNLPPGHFLHEPDAYSLKPPYGPGADSSFRFGTSGSIPNPEQESAIWKW